MSFATGVVVVVGEVACFWSWEGTCVEKARFNSGNLGAAAAVVVLDVEETCWRRVVVVVTSGDLEAADVLDAARVDRATEEVE